MRLLTGNLYYFWNEAENKLGFLTITSTSDDSFTFSMGNKNRGKCLYKDIEGKLFESKWDVPEYRKKYQKESIKNEEEYADDGYDNLVGFEHKDTSGNYKYYPSIYYYQGPDDSLSHGSVYDAEEADDLGL